MRGDDNLGFLNSSLLKSRVEGGGDTISYDSSFLKSMVDGGGETTNLGFFDSSFLEFQETRELMVER